MLTHLGIGVHGDHFIKLFGGQKCCCKGQWLLTGCYFKHYRKETAVVKLEIGIKCRIHCSTTAFETLKKLVGGQIKIALLYSTYPMKILKGIFIVKL